MKTEASYTVQIEVPKPTHEGHIWVRGDYAAPVTITVISRESEEDARAKLRALAEAILRAAS